MADYALEGPRWAASTITWSFAQTNFANQPAQFDSYYSEGPFAFEVRAAFQRWANVANINFVQVADSASADIRVGLANFDGPFGTLGQAAYYYSGSNFLPGSVVRFDAGENYTLQNGAEALQGGVAFKAVALHEIGHALGLDHYDGSPAIMNTSSTPSVRDLLQSDLDGMRALYGAPPYSSLSFAADNFAGTDAVDRVLGLDGDDVLRGLGGSDIIYGNPGSDVVYGNQGDDELFGGRDGDRLYGGQGSDIVYGNLGDDVIYGNLASDLLYGGQGNDVIYGGQGSDLLVANLGDDTLIGGLGADLYAIGRNGGADLIIGFDQSQGDRLDLSGQGYTVLDDGRGNALLVLAAGGSVTLANVRPGDVSGGFIA